MHPRPLSSRNEQLVPPWSKDCGVVLDPSPEQDVHWSAALILVQPHLQARVDHDELLAY